MSGQLKQTVR